MATILVEDGRIRALGSDLVLPEGTARHDVSGKHVFPGLIDAHVNFDPEHDALYVAAGVTTVRDIGGNHVVLLRERHLPARDRVPGPSLITPGAVLDGDPPASADAVVLRNAHAAEDYLPILFEERVDYLSVSPGLPEEARRRALGLAHEKGLKVFGPLPRGATLASALEQGQDGFHSIDALLPGGASWDSAPLPAFDDVIGALARSGRPLVPLFQASAQRVIDQTRDPGAEQLFGLLAPEYEAWWTAELFGRGRLLDEEGLAAGQRSIEKQAAVLRRIDEQGGVLLPGSGSPQPWLFPGQALHQELAQWVRAGLSRDRVLELATRGAAEALGLTDRGTIVAGAWADLVVTAGDPAQDLARLRDPELVVVRGHVLDRQAVEERLGAVAQRMKTLREELSRPVEVEPPPTPAEGVVVLEGQVETESFGVRASTERYRVVRLGTDAVLYTGRVVYPGTAQGPGGQTPGRQMTIQQVLRGGALEEVQVELLEGGSVFQFRGLWTANSWRMQSSLDGRILATTKPLRERPACVEVGSVTTCLVLGQAELGEVHVLQLHAGLESELVAWKVELDDEGDHQIRTHLGRKAFRLDEHGGLELAATQVGPGSLTTRRVSSEAFGGPGLPLPEGKKRARPANAGASPEDGD